MTNTNNQSEVNEMSLDVAVDELQGMYAKYADEPKHLRFILRDISYIMQLLCRIRELNPVSPNSSKFLGITEKDSRAYEKVASLVNIAANILEENEDID